MPLLLSDPTFVLSTVLVFRTAAALVESARARVESERAEHESQVALEQAFPQRLHGVEFTPYEQESRKTTRARANEIFAD